ncbi:hypothetical protein FHR75_000770 [Kineococcus radiotolerans]|uniref:Uncharacterized protein n=1 Tax=Kineococcus radiotolerans TaxID=131568 RepID=A0A7W4TK71_KINRA|nr:hypothetical protein [Kineococcus radiotolerans]MBB2899982.1 hypothetical protein [Kineococcus radiotolerans]
MNLHHPTAPPAPPSRTTRPGPGAPALPLHRLHLMRVGYLLLGPVLAVVQWPSLVDDLGERPLMDGVVVCLLSAMSLLALAGLRHPVAMLPVLVFESVWKLLWLALVALPAALDGDLDAATRELAASCLWVIVVLAVVPWRFAWRRFAAAGDRWR